MALYTILAKKHDCYYHTKEYRSAHPSDNREVITDHLKSACKNGCCLGGDWNEFFETKPTEAQLLTWIEDFTIKGKLAREHAEKRRKQKYCMSSPYSQLITISIDQEYKQPIKAQYDILDRIRKANYKWMTDDATASFEYYGKDGKWNPHVHFSITKTEKPSTIAQALNRVFYETADKKRVKKWEYAIYSRVNCVDRPKETANNYIEGNKADDKMASVDKDKKFREENGIPHIFKIKD